MLLLQIHDSLVARIPRDSVPEVTAAMTDILVRVFERMFSPVPFKADVKPFGRLAYQLEAAK
jgi:DNA polymerase I-like protein with 3'-5' exonuclease and polymerase domains